MKYLFAALLIAATLGVNVSYAQASLSPLKPCLNTNDAQIGEYMLVYVSEPRPYYYANYGVGDFLALEGEQVNWLGYAPRWASEYWLLERQGINYGFEGVNMDLLGETTVLYIVNKQEKPTERFTLTSYGDGSYYFVTKTTANQFGLDDGTAYDYHIEPHPDGGACIWWIESEALDDIYLR